MRYLDIGKNQLDSAVLLVTYGSKYFMNQKDLEHDHNFWLSLRH